MCATLVLGACAPTDTPDEPDTPDNPGTNETPGGEETGGDEEEPEVDKNGKMTYKVYIKDQDGNPIEGVFVSFCIDELCMPNGTNADGLAKSKYLPGTEVHVAITPPEGYTAETEDYYLGGANPTEITVTLTKIA